MESRLQESLERAELELSEALLAWSKFEEVQSQLHQEEGQETRSFLLRVNLLYPGMYKMLPASNEGICSTI